MTAPITPLHIALALMRDVLTRLGRTAPKSVQQWLSNELGVSLPGETHETANETATQPYPILLSRGADNCEDLLSSVDPLDETAESFFHYANPSLSS